MGSSGGGGGVPAKDVGGPEDPEDRSGGSTGGVLRAPGGIAGGITGGSAPAAASSLGRGSPCRDDGEEDDADTVGGVLGCVGGVG